MPIFYKIPVTKYSYSLKETKITIIRLPGDQLKIRNKRISLEKIEHETHQQGLC